MLFQDQRQGKNLVSPPRQSEDVLQWKKASRNLQSFIQSQKLGRIKSFNSPKQQRTRSLRREKMELMKSVGSMYLANNETQRAGGERSSRSREVGGNFLLLKPRYIKSPRNLFGSPKKDTQNFIDKNRRQIAIQTFEEEVMVRKKDLNEQNSCLKELVHILEGEVLSYSKTISEKQNKISELSIEVQNLKENLTKQAQQTIQYKQKFEKQRELNKCMEYIIAELNQKVSVLMGKNAQLQQVIDEYKLKEQRNLGETFSESESRLSIGSLDQRILQQPEVSKSSVNFVEGVESQFLIEDHENWSISGLDMSCFVKTPNKIHEASGSWQEGRFSSVSELLPNQQVEDIILKHKIQINNLKEKLKYYEIQNQMLRRKKEITQKNTLEIEELKFRIEKLSEQNKFMQNQNKRKSKIFSEQAFSKNPAKTKLSSYKQNEVTKKQVAKSKNFEEKALPQSKLQKTQHQKSEDKNLQTTVAEQVKLSPKRKNTLQRKFVRRQSRSPISSSSLEDDELEISLQFSPQRI